MKIEQLQTFIKIVDCGSMNKAANEMFISRSALSTSMKNLESELGSRIFERSNKGITLTPFGTELYMQAKEICERISILKDTSFQKVPVVNLSIANMFCSLANETFVDIYSLHADENFTGNIEEGSLSDTIMQVATGICEVGIITLFSNTENYALKCIENFDLTYEKLADRKLGALVGPKNPLYEKNPESVSLSELTKFPYIVNYSSPADFTLERILDGHTRKRAEIKVSDLGCALNLIHRTKAIMIDTYDKETYKVLHGSANLKFIQISDSPINTKLGWIKRNNTSLSPVAHEFIDLLQKKVNNLQLNF